MLAFERFGTSLGRSKKAKDLERSLTHTHRKVAARKDNKAAPPHMSQLTEAQLMRMTADELREELRRRGDVRRRPKDEMLSRLNSMADRGSQMSLAPIEEPRL